MTAMTLLEKLVADGDVDPPHAPAWVPVEGGFKAPVVFHSNAERAMYERRWKNAMFVGMLVSPAVGVMLMNSEAVEPAIKVLQLAIAFGLVFLSLTAVRYAARFRVLSVAETRQLVTEPGVQKLVDEILARQRFITSGQSISIQRYSSGEGGRNSR